MAGTWPLKPLLEEEKDTSELMGAKSFMSLVDTEQGQKSKGALFNDKCIPKTDWSFFFGITMVLFIAWSVAAIPQHMWLIYMVNAAVLFTYRLWTCSLSKEMTRGKGNPKKLMVRLPYLLELCYYANFLGFATAFVLPWVSPLWSDILFCAAFGIACGPLLIATFLVKSTLMFHSFDQLQSILIHLMPSLVMYTIRWDYTTVGNSWPAMFHRGPYDHVAATAIIQHSCLCYLVWWIPHTIWMAFSGKDLPQKKRHMLQWLGAKNPDDGVHYPFDTVFHFNMCSIGIMFAGIMFVCDVFFCRPHVDDKKRKQRKLNGDEPYEVKEILVHQLFHVASFVLAVPISLLCYNYQLFHQLSIGGATLFALYLGSSKYAEIVDQHQAYDEVKRRAQSGTPHAEA